MTPRSTSPVRSSTRALGAWFLLLAPAAVAFAQATPPNPPAAPATPAKPSGALPGPATPVVPEVRILSVDQAVQLALQRNPNVELAAAAIRRAQGVVAEARSSLLPRLDGNASFTLHGPNPSFSFAVPASPGQPATVQSISLGRTFSKDFSVNATYDPDPFGRLRSNKTAAKRSLNATRGGYFVEQNELVYSVQNVYLAALRAQELIGVAREAIQAAQEQLRVAQAEFRAGVAPEFDVLRATVQVANLRQNLVTAEANYRRTTSMLSMILSLEPATQIQLLPVSLPPEPDAVAIATAKEALEPNANGGVPSTLEAALSEAFDRRPEVYRAQWNRRAAEARVQFERAGNLPSVGLTAGVDYAPDQAGLAVETKTWTILANVSIPIWDAGRTRARTQQARADVDTASAQLQSARDVIADDVRRSLTDLEEARDRRVAAAANTAQAREALRVARVRYQAGLAQNVEVTDAESALTQARANEVNAAYDYLSALAALNRGLGRYAGDRLALVAGSGTVTPPAPPK